MEHFPISTLAWVCSFDPTFYDECSPGVTMNHEFIFLANFREHFLFELAITGIIRQAACLSCMS
jgi:hypothetical protein